MRKEQYTILRKAKLGSIEVHLSSSKSISNRALIIDRLARTRSILTNISEARDTQTMSRLLDEKQPTLDVLDAGTTMRFLTAYFAISRVQKVLTGSPRMCERPIELLVNALADLGAQIEYLENEGFPPISIKPFEKQLNSTVRIRGDVSSQYISALLMVGPSLPNGLILQLTGKIGSRPYIDMTLKIMEQFGVLADWQDDTIIVKPQTYQPTSLTIEPDWSGASYWYSFLALSESGSIKIVGLQEHSIQGDHVIQEMMHSLGVSTVFVDDGAILEKIPHQLTVEFDFTDCPDLAQTVAVVCAAKGIVCRMTGLESLKIKETDRIAALQNELSKICADFQSIDGVWTLTPTTTLPDQVTIETYDDHRMAMSFAPLSMVMDVTITNPSVVEKSFPSFWTEMIKSGFNIIEY